MHGHTIFSLDNNFHKLATPVIEINKPFEENTLGPYHLRMLLNTVFLEAIHVSLQKHLGNEYEPDPNKHHSNWDIYGEADALGKLAWGYYLSNINANCNCGSIKD